MARAAPESAGMNGYRRRMNRGLLCLAGACLALVVLALSDLLIGPAMLSPTEVFEALVTPASSRIGVIVWELRLPMVLTAVVVGASLAVAGAQMQAILGNPLASPYTLGLASAAGCGAATGILFTEVAGGVLPATLLVPAAALIGCAMATGAIYAVARRHGSQPLTMILIGIALMFLFQSLQALVQYRASPEVLQQMIFWLFGSLQHASWERLAVTAAVFVPAVALVARDAWRLTALSLGDLQARSLGIDVEALRRRVFVMASVLTAAAVAFVGTIGFVGLVAPHIARLLVGEEQRLLLPVAAVTGAAVLSAASVLSKLLVPGAVFPIGIVTALVGVPFFLYLVLTRRAVA